MTCGVEPDVHLRDATPADAVALAVLGLHVFVDTYATEGVAAALAREALHAFEPGSVAATLARPGESVVVAALGERLVGFVHWTADACWPSLAAPRQAKVQRLYVLPRFHGAGLGARLLDHAGDAARRAGVQALWLTCWCGNARALRFYARLGWAECGRDWHEAEGERFENRVFTKAL